MKGEAKKSAVISPSSSPSKSVAKTTPATKNVEMSEMMPVMEKSSNKKQVAKQAKAAFRNEPKPADFDEGINFTKLKTIAMLLECNDKLV